MPTDLCPSGAETNGSIFAAPFSHRRCCAVCNGNALFSLQYYNVHLLLAACLHLSLQINEAGAIAGCSGSSVARRVAEVCGCTPAAMLLAERVVCDCLSFELTVTPAAVETLVRRLGAVEVTE